MNYGLKNTDWPHTLNNGEQTMRVFMIESNDGMEKRAEVHILYISDKYLTLTGFLLIGCHLKSSSLLYRSLQVLSADTNLINMKKLHSVCVPILYLINSRRHEYNLLLP